MRSVAAFLTVTLAAASAGAEDRAAMAVVGEEMNALAEQLVLRLDVFSIDEAEPGEMLGSSGLTCDVDMKFDWRKRRAKLRLGGGDDSVFALRLDVGLRMDAGAPRLRGSVRVALAGHQMTLALPDVRLTAYSYAGETYVQYTVPLIEGRF